MQVKRANVESLGATIFHVPSESILTGKHAAAEVALVVALLHVHTLVVPLKIGLANKLLVAVGDGAREGILALLVVGLHMRLEVVAPAKHLAASLDLADKVGLLLGSQAARSSSRPRYPVLPPDFVHEGGSLRAGWPGVELVRLNRVVVLLVPCGGRPAVGEIAGRRASVRAVVRGEGSVDRSGRWVLRCLHVVAVLGRRLHLDPGCQGTRH